MHIWSAQARGHWHPLTSAIRFARPIHTDSPSLPLIPGILDGGWTDEGSKRWIRSTMLHELAHKDAARSTRFGMLLSIAAGRLMLAWRSGRLIVLPEWLDRVCGAMATFLEGTALYAQLDFDINEDEPILPNTITPRLQEYELVDRGAGWQQLLDLYRLEETCELDLPGMSQTAAGEAKHSPGLLRALFLNTTNPGTVYYLAGYLWLKAAAATLSRACPEISRPGLLFPIILKLIFDHPMFIEIAVNGKVPSVDTIVANASDVFSLPTLHRLKALGPVDKPVLAPAQPERLGRCNTDVATG
jgi:hypothetical protein